MCGERRGRSVAAMTYITPIRSLAGAVIAVLLCALAVAVASADAAGKKTDTLRVFSKVMTFTYTAADGTVTKGEPSTPPQAGDSFEVESLDYRGNHKKHSKKPIGAEYLHCVFGSGPEPDCNAFVAIGSSLLRFHGFDLVGATGRWKGGKLISNKDVNGDSDVVVRLVRR
jgi:hypothetical protein